MSTSSNRINGTIEWASGLGALNYHIRGPIDQAFRIQSPSDAAQSLFISASSATGGVGVQAGSITVSAGTNNSTGVGGTASFYGGNSLTSAGGSIIVSSGTGATYGGDASIIAQDGGDLLLNPVNGNLIIRKGVVGGAGYVLKIDSNKNVIFNATDGALATNATNGFLYIPSTAGTPNGVPAVSSTGSVPFIIDTAANKIWGYNSGWVSLGGGSLATTLGIGNTTSGYNIVVSSNDGISFNGATPPTNGIAWGTADGNGTSGFQLIGPTSAAFRLKSGINGTAGQNISLEGSNGSSAGTGGNIILSGGAADGGTATGLGAQLTVGPGLAAGTGGLITGRGGNAQGTGTGPGGLATWKGGNAAGTDQNAGGAVLDTGDSTGTGYGTLTFKAAPASTTGSSANTSTIIGSWTRNGLSLTQGSLGSGSTSSFLSVAGTWNDAGTTFKGAILANITDTNSATGSLLLDLQVATVSKFKVDKSGAVTSTGAFSVSGLTTTSFSSGTVTKVAGDSPYTVAAGDSLILCNATAGAITVNLPAVASSTGRILNIKKIDSSANAVTLDGNSSETIDGQLTQSTTTQYASFTIQCDGSAWYIL